MILRYNNSDGVHVIAWKDGIWKVSDEEDADVYEKISKDLGFSEIFDDFYDLAEYIENRRPDVFIGTITGKEELSPYLKSSFTYGPDSPLIRKTMRILGLSLYVDSSSDEKSTDVTYVDKEIPRQPIFAYHGTTVSAALKIIKFGLRPDNDIENWKFKFDDRVFLTTRKIDAIFHANNAADKQKSLPIIFRFKILDPSLIASDYDVAVAFGELDKEPSYKKTRQMYAPSLIE